MSFVPPADYTIDVHTHPVPDFYRQALVEAGFPTKGEQVWVDGFVTPDFTIESYLANREEYKIHFSILSVTAPGVNFYNGDARAKVLARRLNLQMHEWTQAHPTKLGAFVCLPLPNIEDSLEELKYCLDELHFDGVGLYTNYNGLYLGDPALDPILDELDRRASTVFVHPTSPEPVVDLGLSAPAIEYPFDTTRAIANLLIKGSCNLHPNIRFIFGHGGGTLPFLADRLSGITSLPFQGGFDPKQSSEELKGYYFDLASSTSHPQLAALHTWCGAGRLLTGSDFPYVPARGIPPMKASLASFPAFSAEDQAAIRHGNALSLFPSIVARLAKAQNQS